jgi:hypothetical protein
VGGEHAEGPAGPEHRDERLDRGPDLVDVLEDPVAEDQVGAARLDDVEQPGGVARSPPPGAATRPARPGWGRRR